jgi:(R,R)-butanediol dehydrogenase/meso-butanediol dehydrogenase/diacetyl reductase
VIGAGPIGMLTFQCARAAGAGKVFVVEPNEGRRRIALELGADGAWAPGAELDAALADATDGVGPDIVYDCAGVPATVHAAAKLTRRGGAVCMVGVASERATINPATWVLKELRIDTSAAYGHEDMAIAMGLIADGRVRVAELHHATVGLDQLGDTIAEMASGPSERVKVLVDPHL